MVRAALVAFAFSTLVVGCTESAGPGTQGPGESTQGTQGSQGSQGSQTAQGGEATQTSGCPAGATKNSEGGFCVALPSDVAPAPAASSVDGERRYEYGSGASTIVIVVKTGAMASDAAWTSAKNGLAEQAAKAGGSSKSTTTSVSAVWKEADGRNASTTILRGDAKIVDCRALSTQATVLQVCQSIRLL